MKIFKKVKHSNGKREIYLGKKKIFQYVNQNQFVEFMENRLNGVIHSLSHPLDTAKIVYDINNGGGGKLLSL